MWITYTEKEQLRVIVSVFNTRIHLELLELLNHNNEYPEFYNDIWLLLSLLKLVKKLCTEVHVDRREYVAIEKFKWLNVTDRCDSVICCA